MRKPLLIATVILALVLTAGCGQKDAADAPVFTQSDMLLEVDGVKYACDDNINQVIAHLGENYEYAEGMSCDYDGLDKTYLYDVAEFYTNPLDEGDLLSEIYTVNPAVVTSKGISVGASRNDVLTAYGEDCEEFGGLLIYSLPDSRVSLCFELDADDMVKAIQLTNQPV